MKNIGKWIKGIFFPPPSAALARRILPFALLAILSVGVLIGGVYGWDYTNSPRFCGYTCHTMPPQNIAYLNSPHANVYCTECHIGRGFLGTQLSRKTEDIYEVYSMVFHAYTYPLQASRTRPARETCETCHQPAAFSSDSLVEINRFKEDQNNTAYTTFLVLKTGGGTEQEGLGMGIHWHVMSQVEYYSTDPLLQEIPFVRVHNSDGSVTEYLDATSDLDPASIQESDLRPMDCITCHNRVTHDFKPPADSIDSAMARGLISSDIPEIKKKGVEVVSVAYTNEAMAISGIAGLENYYKQYYPDFYSNNIEPIRSAITALQQIYSETVFTDQKIDWTTHPNNLGHMDSPGCFRCHDGKHLDPENQAIRLECNLCHSIPVVATSNDFITNIEISRGPEPEMHLNPNWISLHNNAVDSTCASCHSVEDPGGTSNTSFCSNAACHGTNFEYAGFNAPELRNILQPQLPTPAPQVPSVPIAGEVSYTVNVKPIFDAGCVVCHNANSLTGGLDLSSYEEIMKGGKDGPIIIVGESANSRLIQIQSQPHFHNVSASELDLLKQWIDMGAKK